MQNNLIKVKPRSCSFIYEINRRPTNLREMTRWKAAIDGFHKHFGPLIWLVTRLDILRVDLEEYEIHPLY